ncbi:MAG: DNA repair exonuclease [Beijerinckiaceae bacterium]|jgi:DNA repair protein SbcD/Mre11|nr:DNA repair exonuclease [Beijerinckiaceae bacterium]
MRFSFIHAADLHIDSPLGALGRRNADAAARFAGASRKAVVALIDETLNSQAKFLIIAGDIFDGDWADYTTGLFFIRELARLERANVPVFIVRGNHDAFSKMSKSLKWPDNVREFSASEAESFFLPELNTVLHGKSFPERNVPDDFVDGYPARHDGQLNIGILHTALDGVRGHASYAPCTVETLKRFGYTYWALGHIHKPDIVARDPWIVFPGNIQGRSIRETGARGAMRVTVDDGGIASVEPVALDAGRWAHLEIDISAITSQYDVLDVLQRELEIQHTAAAGRALAVRVTISGETALHDALIAGHQQLEAEAQGLASRIAYDCWIEKIKLRTKAPVRSAMSGATVDGPDLDRLLQETAGDSAFADTIAALAQDIRSKLPRELWVDFDSQFNAGADTMPVSSEAQALIAGALAQGSLTRDAPE